MTRQELIEEMRLMQLEIEKNREDSRQLVDRVHILANKIHCELVLAHAFVRRELALLDLIIFCNTGEYPTKGN
jgi:hypothetical protein